jgi:hypothetical protein
MTRRVAVAASCHDVPWVVATAVALGFQVLRGRFELRRLANG